MIKKWISFFLIGSLCAWSFVACKESSNGSDNDSIIIGSLAADSAIAKVLGPGDGGISGVTIAALGDTQVTDTNGNFTLKTDGKILTDGPVKFQISGSTVAGDITFDKVALGPGVTGYVDLRVLENGAIIGSSLDAAGNILSEVKESSQLGCTRYLSFQDGTGNNLWKPHSESTGTVVILMPGSYGSASFAIYNANGEQAASVLKRHCCEHNGGRDHVYLSRNASGLAREPLPLTVTYDFGNGRVDCLEVSTPTIRLD